MTRFPVPDNPRQLAALVRRGEGVSLEFKRSTGELKAGMQSLCAMLNGEGGRVLFGIRPEGTIEGQQVSDQTLRDVAQCVDRFEPPADIRIERIPLKSGRDVLVLAVEGGTDAGPFTDEGRAYKRVESTTRKIPQAKYERRLLDRAHSRRRWENEPIPALTLKDLDRKEILRTRELAIQQNRISPETSRDIGEIVDRLGLRVGGVLTHAALVLYGTRFLPDYPQCLLKLGRPNDTKNDEEAGNADDVKQSNETHKGGLDERSDQNTAATRGETVI